MADASGHGGRHAGVWGDFIAFFDDDDESAPQRVRLQIEHIPDYEAQFAGGAR